MQTICQNCGEQIIQTQKTKQKKFCSDICRMTYWNSHRELIQSKQKQTITCINCGKIFTIANQPKRKYCSFECYKEMRYDKKAYPKKEQEKKAYQIIYAGELTVGKATDMQPIIFTGENKLTAPKRIWLVCQATWFGGKIDYFVSRIPEELKSQLIESDVFIFCNRNRDLLSVLQWQGDGFALLYKRLEYGKYPLPITAEAKVIEITKEDFTFIMQYTLFMARCKKWDMPAIRNQEKIMY